MSIFLKIIFSNRNHIKESISTFAYNIILVALFALFLKVLIQAIIVIPAMAAVSYSIRNFVIGFIHLLMLGCLSLFIIGIVRTIIQIPINVWGTKIFVGGIIITEMLLFAQGLMLWQKLGFMPYYYLTLMLASTLIVIGISIITCFLVYQLRNPKYGGGIS